MGQELVVGEVSTALHPFGFVALYVHRHGDLVEQLTHALDLKAHHRATNMVDVIVGGEHTGHAHLVFGDDVEQPLHVIRRVDQHGVAGVAIPDGVDKVDHLTSNR